MYERDLAPLLALARFAMAGEAVEARDYIARWLSSHPVGDGSDAAIREQLAELLLATRRDLSQPIRRKRARLSGSRNEAVFSERAPAESVVPSSSAPRMTTAMWSDAASTDAELTDSYAA